MKKIIVCRDMAKIEFIAVQLGGTVNRGRHTISVVLPGGETIKVICDRDATTDEMMGVQVYGDVSYHSAVGAECVWVVEITGSLPGWRPALLGELVAAGASLVCYRVTCLGVGGRL